MIREDYLINIWPENSEILYDTFDVAFFWSCKYEVQGWRQLTNPHELPVISLPLQAFTFCFQSLHENIAWFALHVSQPHSDDQTICG